MTDRTRLSRATACGGTGAPDGVTPSCADNAAKTSSYPRDSASAQTLPSPKICPRRSLWRTEAYSLVRKRPSCTTCINAACALMLSTASTDVIESEPKVMQAATPPTKGTKAQMPNAIPMNSRTGTGISNGPPTSLLSSGNRNRRPWQYPPMPGRVVPAEAASVEMTYSRPGSAELALEENALRAKTAAAGMPARSTRRASHATSWRLMSSPI